MSDPHTIPTVASLINSAISSAKSAKELAKDSKDTNLKNEISEIYSAMLELKGRALEFDEENRDLKRQLNERASIKRSSRSGYWYKEGEDDPLCPSCFEGPLQTAAYLSPPESGDDEEYQRVCNVCKTIYLCRQSRFASRLFAF